MISSKLLSCENWQVNIKNLNTNKGIISRERNSFKNLRNLEE